VIVFLVTAMVLAVLSTPATAAEPVEQQGLVDKALVTFRAFMADREMEWFHVHLKEAKALLIIPQLIKGGYIIGGSGGSGVFYPATSKKKSRPWRDSGFQSRQGGPEPRAI